MDYYGHGPLIELQRPLCITGFMGARVNATAKSIAALAGVPVVELDREVEHRAGKSLSHLVLKEGADRRRTLELEALEREISGRPKVIALGDGALLNPKAADLVAAKATLVYLEWSLVELAKSVRERLEENPGRYPELLLQDQPTALGLSPLLGERAPGYKRADFQLQGKGQPPWKLAQEILAWLQGGPV